MQAHQPVTLLLGVLLCSATSSCIPIESIQRTGEFWLERNHDTVAMYEKSPKDDDCILATGPEDILKTISEHYPSKAEVTFEVEKYPVFVPTFIGNEAAYDMPAIFRGRRLERMCVSQHLYWIKRVRILPVR